MKNHIARWGRLGGLVAAGLLLASCDDHSEGSTGGVNPARSAASAPSDVPNLEGSWSGTYSTPTGSQGLEADIQQSGRRVEIVTSKDGEAHSFAGAFRAKDNVLDLIDLETDEEWTSNGRVSKHHLQIRDYLWEDGAEHDPDNVQVVDLSR